MGEIRPNGPSLIAPAIWGSNGEPATSLHPDDRSALLGISTVVRFRKGETIYRLGDDADAVFSVRSGIVTSFKAPWDGKRHIVGFLFPGDLFGMAEHGRYSNGMAAITPVVAYRLPAGAVEAGLRANARLDFQVICHLCHEVRDAQWHALLLSEHRAAARVGLFLGRLEARNIARGGRAGDVPLPMNRADIGAYLGISAESVSRTLREFVHAGVIQLVGRRQVRIINQDALTTMISGPDA